MNAGAGEADGIRGALQALSAAAPFSLGCLALTGFLSPFAPAPVLGEDDAEKDQETGTGREGLGFAVKASVVLEVDALPQDVRSVLVLATQLGEGGFKTVSAVHGRLVDVSSESSKKWCDLATYHHDSAEFEEEKVTVCAIAKIYREFKQSAYWSWRSSGAASLHDFMQEKDTKALLREIMAQKRAKDEQEKKPDEEEEEEDEDGPKKRLKADDWQWRVRSLGLKFAAASLDDLERDLADIATYEGRRNKEGLREDKVAKACYKTKEEKEDSFFGEYKNDLRDGLGIYIFANGGVYAGGYKEGKRDGQGILMFPDGSMYEGEFANDKFDGQGTYTYADGSQYIGQWKNGKRDGEGAYWYPGFQSCLRGQWKEGYANGTVTHETLRHQFTGTFDRGVPEGPGKFTISAEDRLAGQRLVAASYLLMPHGPSLTTEGSYNCPVPQTDDEPPAEEGEEGAVPRIPDPTLRAAGAKYASGDYVAADSEDPIFPVPGVPMPPAVAALLHAEQPAQA